MKMKQKKYLSDNYIQMQLTKGEFDSYKKVRLGCKISKELAKKLCKITKQWALQCGATHYVHCFFPFDGMIAEKYIKLDACLDGTELLTNQVDASNFANNKTICTNKACGYSFWDFSENAFISSHGEIVVLNIPATLSDYRKNYIDYKMPLNRSCVAINKSAKNMLRLLGINNIKFVKSNIGCEQEFFLFEKHFSSRLDLQELGQTLFGSPYVQKRNYCQPLTCKMDEFVSDLIIQSNNLGIEIELFHSEVAPNQFEMVQKYTNSNKSCYQNVLLMRLIEQVADRHNLVAIFNEKPFKNINGSGKHMNWSLCTNENKNLIDPNNISPQVFLTFFVGIISAIDNYSKLLMSSVATFENRFRLGGDEAPPIQFSVHVGKELKTALINFANGNEFVFEQNNKNNANKKAYNRNRTSPFAFTGNKFEFRAVGASQNPMLSATILNSVVAHQLNNFCKLMESGQTLENILRNEVWKHIKIINNGNCYKKQAKKKKLTSQKQISHANQTTQFDILQTQNSSFDLQSFIKNPHKFSADNLNSYQLFGEFMSDKSKQLFLELKVYKQKELRYLNKALSDNYIMSATKFSHVFLNMVHKDILLALQKFYNMLVSSNKISKIEKYNEQLIEMVSTCMANLHRSSKIVANWLEMFPVALPKEVAAVQYKSFMFDNYVFPEINQACKDYECLENYLPKEFLPFETYKQIFSSKI